MRLVYQQSSVTSHLIREGGHVAEKEFLEGTQILLGMVAQRGGCLGMCVDSCQNLWPPGRRGTQSFGVSGEGLISFENVISSVMVLS